MKKNVIKVVFVAAIAMVAGINVFNAQKSEVLSDTVLANVEALADDLETGNVKSKYCTIHIRCFDSNGSSTGKYRADSFRGESCSYEVSHDHGCENCSSR